jgi:hypothetical protein
MEAQERIEQLHQKMKSDWKQFGQVVYTEGAFGDTDMSRCTGLVELPILMPKEGGTFTKFYGCSFLFKGNPDKGYIKFMGFPKALVSILPREIMMRSWVLLCAVAFLFAFARKRLYRYAWVYVFTLQRNFFNLVNVPWERYNAPVKELKRSMDRAIALELERTDRVIMNEDELLSGPSPEKKIGIVPRIVANGARFFYFFIEHDHAYRFPLQDILPLINKERLQRHCLHEVDRLFLICLSRASPHVPEAERSCSSFTVKINGARKMLLAAMIVCPAFRRIMRDFLLDLDCEKVRLDDDDWYFCLDREIYDYRGIPHAERFAEKERIDRERGHVLFTIEQKPVEKDELHDE